MVGRGSAMGKGNLISRTTKSACLEAQPKIVPKENRIDERKRDKLVEVQMCDRATAAIGEFHKFMRLPSS